MKALTVRPLDRKEHADLYALLEEIYEAHHYERMEQLRPRICLAVKIGWNPDKDGIKRLGQCRRVTELDRQLHDFDYVILIHCEVIANKTEFGERLLRALIDHELCHCAVSLDKKGEVRTDEAGNPIYRIRKHDIEEFGEIVTRHGSYKSDLAEFMERVLERSKRPLLSGKDKATAV